MPTVQVQTTNLCLAVPDWFQYRWAAYLPSLSYSIVNLYNPENYGLLMPSLLERCFHHFTIISMCTFSLKYLWYNCNTIVPKIAHTPSMYPPLFFFFLLSCSCLIIITTHFINRSYFVRARPTHGSLCRCWNICKVL